MILVFVFLFVCIFYLVFLVFGEIILNKIEKKRKEKLDVFALYNIIDIKDNILFYDLFTYCNAENVHILNYCIKENKYNLVLHGKSANIISVLNQINLSKNNINVEYYNELDLPFYDIKSVVKTNITFMNIDMKAILNAMNYLNIDIREVNNKGNKISIKFKSSFESLNAFLAQLCMTNSNMIVKKFKIK